MGGLGCVTWWMSSVGICEIDGVDIPAVEGFRGGGGSDLRCELG